MINDRKRDKAAVKEKVRRRINADFDRSKYRYIPEEKPVDYYDNDVQQKVGIYVRVSTDDVRQTTSYELQKKYYEDFVDKHPHWTLVKIYADEGISGTSTKHREAFKQMISDAKAHKIDLIITKSVSRFARNVQDFLGAVRDLTEQKPPVGIFFESEAIHILHVVSGKRKNIFGNKVNPNRVFLRCKNTRKKSNLLWVVLPRNVGHLLRNN